MYTEATTKDGNQGIIVKAETVSEILDECSKWVKDNNLDTTHVAPAKLMLCGTSEPIGEIAFTEEGVVCCMYQ